MLEMHLNQLGDWLDKAHEATGCNGDIAQHALYKTSMEGVLNSMQSIVLAAGANPKNWRVVSKFIEVQPVEYSQMGCLGVLQRVAELFTHVRV